MTSLGNRLECVGFDGDEKGLKPRFVQAIFASFDDPMVAWIARHPLRHNAGGTGPMLSFHDDNDIETICTVKLGGTRIVVTGMAVYACRTFLLSSAGPVAVPQQILNKRLRFNSTRRLISLQ